MSVFADLQRKKTKLAVVGLGYVGMPIAVAFAHFEERLYCWKAPPEFSRRRERRNIRRAKLKLQKRQKEFL